MKRKIFSILFALVLACSLGLVTAVPAVAQGATWYVATDGSDAFGDGTETWVDADTSLDWNEGDTGPWLTISHTISQASDTDTDTIIVAAGTYDEAVLIDKKLTLLGAQYDVDPTVEGARIDELAESIIDAGGLSAVVTITADSVIVNGFTITNGGGDAPSHLRGGVYLSGTLVSGCTISNNKIIENLRDGIDSCSSGSGVNVFENNVISDNGYGAVYLGRNEGGDIFRNNVISYNADSGETGQIGIQSSDNIVEGNTINGDSLYGILIMGSGVDIRENNILRGNIINRGESGPGFYCGILISYAKNTLVEDNTIHNNIWSLQYDVAGAGVSVGGSADTTSLRENDIQGNGYGLKVGYPGYDTKDTTIEENDVLNNDLGIWIRSDIAASTTHINLNNIEGNTDGVINDGIGSVDATNNWWGNATGADPDTEANNPHGANAVGDKVSDNVDFTPWYATETTTDTTEYVSVDHEFSSVIALSDTIQGGIDAAVDDDTVIVVAGTYNEAITIDKGLTLEGAQVGEDPRGGRVGDESIIDGTDLQKAIHLGADDVTIDGFTISFTGTAGWTFGTYGIFYAGTSNAEIKNNIIGGFYFGTITSGACTDYTISNNVIDDCLNGMYLDSAKNFDIINNALRTGGTLTGGGAYGNVEDILFHGNEISSCAEEDNQWVAGFAIWDAVQRVTFTNNEIFDNTRGIFITHQINRTSYTDPPDNYPHPRDIVINNNNFYDNDRPGGIFDSYAVENAASDEAANGWQGIIHHGEGYDIISVNATMNWWGGIGGPGGEGLGNGDNVTANVVYDPWLTEDFDTVITDGIRSYGSDAIELQAGWNTLSVPCGLKGSADTFSEIETLGDFLTDNNFVGGYSYDASNGDWVLIVDSTTLEAGKGFCVQMSAASRFPVLYFDGMLDLPAYDMYAGWNLIGSAFGIDKTKKAENPIATDEADYGVATLDADDDDDPVNASEDAESYMDLSVALNSLKTAASVVVSPSVPGQLVSWAEVYSDTTTNVMCVGEAYWVFMTANGTLAGFEVTPFYFTWEAP